MIAKNFVNLVEYKKTLKLTKLQKQILVGTLLGHAYIVKQKFPSSTYNIKFEQFIDKKQYIIHLYYIFKDWVGTGLKIRNIETVQVKKRQLIWFRTFRHKSFNYYYKIFYNNNSKTVPKFIGKLLTPVSIAYWYMDHGIKLKNGYVLCTYCFNLSDNKKLIKILNNKYNFDARIYRDKKYYYIFIKNILQFNFIVRPHIIKLFDYKLHL